MRLDLKLVDMDLFKTRSKAQDAIKSKLVKVDGKIITKTGYDVNDEVIEVSSNINPYVSRGGLKLEKAIRVFKIDLSNKKVLDIGSSTGGFSDCSLKHGASSIIAVDVGSDQFDSELRKDKRISLYEKTDFRLIDNSIIDDVDIIVMDVSFISITMLIQKISTIKSKPSIMCLIKPQFECSREVSFKYKGIIRDKEVHQEAIDKVTKAFSDINYKLIDIDESPIKGGDGNTEFIAYFMYDI